MYHLGFEIHRLSKLMHRELQHSDAHQHANRMTGMHGYLIRYLYENRERDVFQRDLEKKFSISRSAVTATLQLMEKNGLVTRESVPQDARLKRIILTQKALDLHQQIEADIAEFEKRLCAGLTPEEQAQLLAIVRKMYDNLEHTKKEEGSSQ